MGGDVLDLRTFGECAIVFENLEEFAAVSVVGHDYDFFGENDVVLELYDERVAQVFLDFDLAWKKGRFR